MNDSQRADRAKEIAARGQIARAGDMWLVPSQTGDAVYRVTLDGEQLRCTCPDFDRRQQPCKHIMAAAIVAQRAA